MKQYINKYFNKKLLYFSVFSIVFASLIPALFIHIRSDMIDFAISQNSKFVMYAVLLTLLFLVRLLILNMQERISTMQKIRSSHKLDKDRLTHCSKLPFEYTETEEFYKLNAAAMEAPGILHEAYGSALSILQCSIQLLATMVTICFINIYVAVIITLLLVVEFLLNKQQVKNVANLWMQYRQNIRKSDYLSSILLKKEYATERKIFNYHNNISQHFDTEYHEALHENCKLGLKRLSLDSLSQVANALVTMSALILLTRPLLENKITLGLFLSTFYSTTTLLACSTQLSASAYAYISSRKKLHPYETLMEKSEEPLAKLQTEDLFQSLEFRHVTFQYPNANTPILQDVSFKLEKGKHYALVGENGSGKTTILKCLVGLYTPLYGQILINNKEIHEYSKQSLQRLLTAVFQDYYKYPLTLRENITLCTKNAPSDDLINHLMKELHMEKTLEHLPNGLDSELFLMKDNSSELSGGEWQKLSVLRCVLSDSSFAILDEPNSALDPIVEASIYNAYRQMLNEKTTLFISHRLGSVKIADEILVLKNGCISAQGSHEQLMNTCAYYATLFETQKGFYAS